MEEAHTFVKCPPPTHPKKHTIDRVQYRFFVGRAPEAPEEPQQDEGGDRALGERLKGPRVAVVSSAFDSGSGSRRSLKVKANGEHVGTGRPADRPYHRTINHSPSPSPPQHQQQQQEEEEEEEEEDVVELPFVDSYYNLSVKTAHLLRWPVRQVRA